MTIRQIIRELILEIKLSQKQQAIDSYQQNNQQIVHGPGPRRGQRLQIVRDEDDKEKIVDPYPEVTELRRNYKRIFNASADHTWFEEKVTCIHWIKYITHHGSSKGTYKEKIRRLLFGKPKIRPGTRSKNEFSTLGYVDNDYSQGAKVGIKIKEKYVTFAAVVDSWTEFNWKTPESIRNFYAGSGLPKRPYQSISPYGIIFDEDDFNNAPGDYMKEVIVDNWTWDTIVIREAWARDDREIQEMIDYIENEWNKENPNHIINIEYF